MSQRPDAKSQAITAVILVLLLAAWAPVLNAQALHSGDPAKSAPARSSPAAVIDGSDPYFREIYKQFYATYRLGPEDEIAIRVVGQPDYTLEKAAVSPFGLVYHPLIGDLDVAGLTIDQVRDLLTTRFSDYIIRPAVSVSLLTANSAKIGVLGDVNKPGIVIMSRPMTVLDALSAVGGVTDYGSKSNVTVLRQAGEGRMRTVTVNMKRVMQAKAGPEENIPLQAGDTVIVHGNFKKTLSTITQLAGFGYFVKSISGQ